MRSAVLEWLSRGLLALSVLASVAVAGLFGLFVYLIIGGYSGGNSPTSVTALLFPVAFGYLLVIMMPSALVCALLWLGYRAASARSRGRIRLR